MVRKERRIYHSKYYEVFRDKSRIGKAWTIYWFGQEIDYEHANIIDAGTHQSLAFIDQSGNLHHCTSEATDLLSSSMELTSREG